MAKQPAHDRFCGLLDRRVESRIAFFAARDMDTLQRARVVRSRSVTLRIYNPRTSCCERPLPLEVGNEPPRPDMFADADARIGAKQARVLREYVGHGGTIPAGAMATNRTIQVASTAILARSRRGQVGAHRRKATSFASSSRRPRRHSPAQPSQRSPADPSSLPKWQASHTLATRLARN